MGVNRFNTLYKIANDQLGFQFDQTENQVEGRKIKPFDKSGPYGPYWLCNECKQPIVDHDNKPIQNINQISLTEPIDIKGGSINITEKYVTALRNQHAKLDFSKLNNMFNFLGKDGDYIYFFTLKPKEVIFFPKNEIRYLKFK